ncbi:MAG: riboflavin synthase [Candidatus Omnitrophica bacterium]|nr:riboflavin synthase [Candidatus Omnitrophota bacterium]
MFTGIVKEIGVVTYFSRYQKAQNLMVRSKLVSLAVAIGDSVSVNGVCLTATKIKSDILVFDLLAETLKLTNLGLLKAGDRVNLEDSLKANDKISGHFVTGHIDCMGAIRKRGIINKNQFIEVAVPSKFMNLMAVKGSVTIDGVSLTIVDVFRDSFTVYLIPHTMSNTILGKKNTGKKVNIEFDILAKYALNSKGATVL